MGGKCRHGDAHSRSPRSCLPAPGTERVTTTRVSNCEAQPSGRFASSRHGPGLHGDARREPREPRGSCASSPGRTAAPLPDSEAPGARTPRSRLCAPRPVLTALAADDSLRDPRRGAASGRARVTHALANSTLDISGSWETCLKTRVSVVTSFRPREAGPSPTVPQARLRCCPLGP